MQWLETVYLGNGVARQNVIETKPRVGMTNGESRKVTKCSFVPCRSRPLT